MAYIIILDRISDPFRRVRGSFVNSDNRNVRFCLGRRKERPQIKSGTRMLGHRSNRCSASRVATMFTVPVLTHTKQKSELEHPARPENCGLWRYPLTVGPNHSFQET